jgi:hypothetical protein
MFNVFLPEAKQGSQLHGRNSGLPSGCKVSHPSLRHTQTLRNLSVG